MAYFLCEAARYRAQRDLLSLANRWCEATRTWTALPDLDGAGRGSGSFGFMSGEIGLCYVEALIALLTGDRGGARAAVERIDRSAGSVGEAARNDSPTDFFSGVAGILCAAESLRTRLPEETDYGPSRVALERVRDRMVAKLLARHSKALDPGPRDPLGFAHGIAGELWALVVALGAEHDVVRARLAELAALGEFDADGLLYWLPSRVCSDAAASLLGSWCNGMAGHTLLWCEVARRTRDETAMGLARLCAVTSSRVAVSSFTFCCGLAGLSLALERYADLSGDAHYRRHAYRYLLRAARGAEAEVEFPFPVLMQGTLGIAVIALGRLHGERAIPLFEP